MISVNGVRQPLFRGLRAPGNTNPVEDVTSKDLICGAVEHISREVVHVAGGDEIGAWYQRGIGGPLYDGDPDNPIAASHKGPITAWLARVKDARTSPTTGLEWFKISEQGFNHRTGVWAVDKLIENDGWTFFRIPSCIAPGDYLLRVELLALHSAYDRNGAQFYTSCANLRVTRGGRSRPRKTYSIPGVYDRDDPAILRNIYGSDGRPTNRFEPYRAPGPRPIACRGEKGIQQIRKKPLRVSQG